MTYDPIQELTYRQGIEKSLIEKVGLSEFRSGVQVVRDERGWRQDEKSIDYIWIVIMSRSFIGWGGLITIKFNEYNFRNQQHPGELVQGVFDIGHDNRIKEFYQEKTHDDHADHVIGNFQLDLFNANKGITLDGVSYTIHVVAANIDTVVTVNTPNTPGWKRWETGIWRLGKTLTERSQNNELIKLFA